MNKLVVLSILFFLICAGCVETFIVDDINIISALGYDSEKDGKFKGTAVIPIYNPDKTVGNLTFEATAEHSKEFSKQIQDKSGDPLVNGSVEVVLYGKELAEEGVNEIIDTLQRDANIGGDLFLAVVDGKANEILKKELGNQGTGSHLFTLLEHNMTRRDMPRTNLHIFLRSLYGRGRDPFTPYISLEEGKVNVKGVALFKDDKVVDYVTGDDLFFLKALMMNSRNGSYTLHLKEEKLVTIDSIVLNRKFDIKDPLSNPTVRIDIKIAGEVTEFSGQKIDPKVIKEIGKEFEKKIAHEAESLLNQFKKQGIDPVGLGHIARTKMRNFDFKKWDDLYPTAEIQVNAKVIITETGVIE